MPNFEPLSLAGAIERRAASHPDFAVLTIDGAGVRPDEVRTYLARRWSSA